MMSRVETLKFVLRKLTKLPESRRKLGYGAFYNHQTKERCAIGTACGAARRHNEGRGSFERIFRNLCNATVWSVADVNDAVRLELPQDRYKRVVAYIKSELKKEKSVETV
jgi:hypothetical protein